MAVRRVGAVADRQRITLLQQQSAVAMVQAASSVATISETIDTIDGSLGDGLADKQAQINALVARLDAAEIP